MLFQQRSQPVAIPGGGKDRAAADRREDVRILDIYQNAASARIDASHWVDYYSLRSGEATG